MVRVDPKIAQRLARHPDINLTMSRYSHTLMGDEAKGLEALPPFPSVFDRLPHSERTVLRATGTDAPATGHENAGTTGERVLPLCLPEEEPWDRANVQFRAVNEPGELESPTGSPTAQKTTRRPENAGKKASETGPDDDSISSTPHRIRTCNLRFRRPMLYPIELGVLSA